ncbi:hypothetical protein OPV22_003757 [Ensete ventricosum]|uniref:Uncharacterized protein n=1 Tax=Ensete ventricosum TaxID=4639 RepID=A0AAV8S1R9_ENSVE|nr:hypothetical protein OPV22_003757 [Ensete ventricosum]
MDAGTGSGGGGRGPEDRAAGERPRRSRYTTRVFVVLLFASLYLLTRRWRAKERASAADAALTPSEIAGAVSFVASLLYLLPVLRDF